MQRLMGLALLGIIGREAFSGAARYYLGQAGLGAAWFLADLVLIVAISVVILSYIVQKVEDRYLYVTLAIAFFLSVGIFSGYAHGNNTSSIVSAVKIALPLIGTLIVYPRYLEMRFFRIGLGVIFALAVLGVIYNRSAEMPWAGYSIEQFGLTRAAARQWWINGESRIAGFGASSSSSAVILLVMTLLIVREFRHLPWKLGVYAAGFTAIYFTTSRTPLIALCCAALIDFWPPQWGRRQNYDRPFLAALFLVVTLVPILYSMVVVFGDDIAHFKYNSLLDRLHFTWPTVLGISYDGGLTNILFGQGFGSIGSPAHYSGKYISPISAIDNFMLYMFSLFGMLSLILGLLIFICFLSINWRERYFAFATCLMMATVNCEGTGGMLIVGFPIAFGIGAYQARRETRTLRRIPNPPISESVYPGISNKWR